jgi:arabinofuranan 3-O-arabinosyltransferase
VLAAFALALLGYRILLVLANPEPTIAIRVFWRAAHAVVDGRSPYDVETRTLSFVDGPVAVPFIAPLGLVSFSVARVVKLVVDVACTAAAVGLALRCLDLHWRSPVGAVVLLACAWLEPVRFVLAEGNFEPECLLALVAVAYFASRSRWGWAGLALGLSFSLKPILVLVLIVFLLARQWKASVVAVGVAGVFTALGTWITPSAGRFVSDVLPFLARGQGEDLLVYNVSLQGAFRQLGYPDLSALPLRAAVVLLVGIVVARQARAPRWWDDGRTLLEVTGLLVMATLLCFSYSFPHYTFYLLPLVLAALTRATLSTAVGLGLAIFGLATIYAPLPLGELQDLWRLLPLLGELALLGVVSAHSNAPSRDAGVHGATEVRAGAGSRTRVLSSATDDRRE